MYNETLIVGILIGIIIGFMIGFVIGVITNKQINLKRQEVFGSIFFLVWLGMHLYGFLNKLEVPLIFDVVGASSAGMILGVEVSKEFASSLLSKIGRGK